MKIALIGYGKMGKEIEQLALDRKHEIVLKIDPQSKDSIEQIEEAEVAIEFTTPDSAVSNIESCLNHQVPIVVGTTGWYDQWNSIEQLCEAKEGSLLAATNFSVGVNLFFALNRQLAQIMQDQSDYSSRIDEIHHLEKLDHPSGTAITLAEGIIEEHPNYDSWVNEDTDLKGKLNILSHREAGVPGTHEITYSSSIDEISIKHRAKNRKGFALGAVLAAEYIANKKGIFTMKDVLNLA